MGGKAALQHLYGWLTKEAIEKIYR